MLMVVTEFQVYKEPFPPLPDDRYIQFSATVE